MKEMEKLTSLDLSGKLKTPSVLRSGARVVPGKNELIWSAGPVCGGVTTLRVFDPVYFLTDITFVPITVYYNGLLLFYSALCLILTCVMHIVL